MARIIYVPIERLEERYSYQWDKWFQHAFIRDRIHFIAVGDDHPRKIYDGQFLDVIGTNQYKCDQLAQILEIIEADPKEPTTIFFMDLWFPGIQSIAYVRDGLKAPIKIVGMMHAGTYDEHDFLSQCGMEVWGRDFESSVLKIADRVLVGSMFHVKLMQRAGLEVEKKAMLVDWPVETNFTPRMKDDIVVFPHRLAPEKQPQVFDELEKLYHKKYGTRRGQFIKTKEACSTKKDYYELLAISKVAVSTALQETFGIAMIEAVNNGCIPVVPDRLSYQETLKNFRRYDNLLEAVDLIHQGLIAYERPPILGRKDITWLRQALQF